MDCKATNILRLGCISHSKMPNTLKTLSVLESFYVLFTDLQVLYVYYYYIKVKHIRKREMDENNVWSCLLYAL